MANQLIVGAFTNHLSAGGAGTVAAFQALQTAAGGNVLVRRSFNSGMPTSIASTEAAGDAAAGIVTFLSVKPSYTSPTSSNAAITALANSMPAGSYLTAWHEPENDMTGAQYVAMFRNFYSVAKAANPNIYVGCAFMTYQWGAGRKVTTPDAWWVGSVYCDFLFTDTYMDTWQKDSSGNPKTLDVDPDHQRWHTWAVTKGKPLGLAESGVGQGFTDTQRAAYYSANETWLVNNGYRMFLPWNGLGTPPNGQSWDFYGGASSWPLTFAAYQGIAGRGQADAVLNPTSAVTAGFVAATTAGVNATSAPITLASGLKGGDGLLLFVAYATPVGTTPTTITTPTGWTVAPSSGNRSSTSSSNGLAVQVFYKTAAGAAGAASADSNTTVTINVSQICKIDVIASAYRGVTPTPATVSFGVDPQTALTTHGPTPAVSPSVASYVAEFFAGKNGATANTSYTTPSGLTKRAEVYGSGNAVDAVLFGSGTTVTSGGGHSTTAAQPSTYEVFATIVLAPIGSGGTTYSAPVITDVTSVADSTDPTIVTLSLTATDPAAGTLTTTVRWGDGTTSTTTSGTITHDYATPGAYTSQVSAQSSVSNLTSATVTKTIAAAAGNGLSARRGWPLPLAGSMNVTALSKFLREQLIPAQDLDVDVAIGGGAGTLSPSQFCLFRNWIASTVKDPVAGTVALTGGNIYWWEMVAEVDGNATAFDLEVTTALAGATGTVFALRSSDGTQFTSTSGDAALGATGVRRVTFSTTPVSRGDNLIASLYVPPSGTVTLRGSTATATTVSLGSSQLHRISVVATASSNPTQLTLSAGSATPIPLLGLR